MHVDELKRMNAKVDRRPQCSIEGIPALLVAQVNASDLRAECPGDTDWRAEGVTEAGNVYHIDRGTRPGWKTKSPGGRDMERIAGNGYFFAVYIPYCYILWGRRDSMLKKTGLVLLVMLCSY